MYLIQPVLPIRREHKPPYWKSRFSEPQLHSSSREKSFEERWGQGEYWGKEDLAMLDWGCGIEKASGVKSIKAFFGPKFHWGSWFSSKVMTKLLRESVTYIVPSLSTYCKNLNLQTQPLSFFHQIVVKISFWILHTRSSLERTQSDYNFIWLDF